MLTLLLVGLSNIYGILMRKDLLFYHFHHHIMFVWYFPFLLMTLVGVDKYIEKKKPFLLMIGVFLTLMTNYYYGVSALLVVLLYGVYKLVSK